MRMRELMGAAAAAAVFVSAQASAQQQVHGLADDPAAFGRRQGVNAMAVSPDGTKLVYVAPAKDRWWAAMVVDVATGADKPILAANANPEMLRWCNFVGNARLVCRITGDKRGTYDVLLGFNRLVSMNLDGTDIKQLGQQSSFYDAGLRQFDGSILDWHPDRDGSVLMERAYVPETGKTGSRLAVEKRGLGSIRA